VNYKFLHYSIAQAAWLFVVLCALISPAQAEASSAKGMEPGALISQLFDEMNVRLKSDQALIETDRKHLVSLGHEVLGPYVSFTQMAKGTLGKHWRKITKDQQQRYVSAFKNRISTAMVSQYDPAKGYTLKVTGERLNKKKTKAYVKSDVRDVNTGEKHAISYKLYLSSKHNVWQVYDVIVEGISLLESFKMAGGEEIRRNGIEHLIAQLETSPQENKETTTPELTQE